MSNIVQIRNNIKDYYKKKKEDYWNSRRKRISKERNDKWNKYYSNAKWHNLRNSYYATKPCCEICAAEGIVKSADEIHHRKKFSAGNTEQEKFELLLSWDNLISVCHYHHHLIHKMMREQDRDEINIEEVIDYERNLESV